MKDSILLGVPILLAILNIRLTQGAQCNLAADKINNDGTLPSCYNSYGCLWDLSQCSPCLNSECKCQTYNTCDECVDGKYYNSKTNKCESCPDNCIKCCQRQSITDYICSVCASGYKLIGGICVNTEGCKKLIDNSNKCSECNDGYYLDEFATCQKCFENCKTCRTQYDCITCNTEKAKLDSNGICVSCPGCATPVTPAVVLCNPATTTTVTNCDTYTYDLSEKSCRCIRCKPGYYLNSYIKTDNKSEQKCNLCDDPTNANQNGLNNYSVRCQQDLSDYTTSVVLECDITKNYILDLYTYTCYDNSVRNCRRIFNEDCSDCYDGYYPEWDIPSDFINCYKNQVEGCITPTNKGTECTLCKDGYFLENKICQKCNKNCSSSSCEICKTCDATGCKECNSGYRLKDGTCSKCINQNCDQCEELEKTCTKCKVGYGLNTQAKEDDDQCIKCQDNCKTCDVDFRKCTECSSDYYNEDYVCKKQPSNCILHQNGFCIQCEFGYIAEGGYCLKCFNEDIGLYNCPSTCSDSEISLVELLHSNFLRPSLLFIFIAYIISIILQSYIFN